MGVRGSNTERVPCGFALVELAVVVVVGILIAALVFPLADRSRRLGRIGEDLAHLRALGAMTGQYASDSGDRFWTFSWVHGQVYQTQYPDLNNAADDLQAAANQAVYLMRTRGNRPTMPVLSAVLAHVSYSHLVLADYGHQRFPWLTAVSSGDANRLRWERDPDCFFSNCAAPLQPDATNPINWRYFFSASFQPSPAFFDGSPVGSRLSQSGQYNAYLVPGTVVLGGQLLSGVTFPSQKVLLSDQNAWHFGSRQPFCTHQEARLPILMVDGSCEVRAARDSNPGWQPNSPQSLASTVLTYSSTPPWQPAPLTPPSDTVYGSFRWTRQGLAGRDFGGPEAQ